MNVAGFYVPLKASQTDQRIVPMICGFCTMRTHHYYLGTHDPSKHTYVRHHTKIRK
jgi:hypothetical protein